MEDELFDYGTFKLRKDALVHNINNEKNLLKAIDAYRFNELDERDFRAAVAYLAKGITDGTITKDLEFTPEEGLEGLILLNDSGTGIKDNKMHSKAISYFKKIAEAQGNHKDNKRATLIKKKEYDDISTYLAKSLYPNATGLNDPNIDWDSFSKKYKNNSQQAVYDILSGFSKSENTDPVIKSKLEVLLPKLIDNDGISIDDKLELNRAGITGSFIPFLDKLVKVEDTSKNGKQENTGNSGGDDPKVVTPPADTPLLLREVKNIAEIEKNGDWYQDGIGKSKKKYVYWNNQFHDIPINYVKEDRINIIREHLKNVYKNRYSQENMEEKLEHLTNVINDRGSNLIFNNNNFDFDNTLKELESLLLKSGVSDATSLIRSVADLRKPYFNIFTPTSAGGISISYQQGGNIIKADGGVKLLYDPNNELYKSLYKEGAQSQGLVNANNSLRSKDLKFNTTYDKELVLNDYYKQYNLYNNPEDRHKDFLTWANKYYQEGDDLNSLFNRYNEGIDNIYKYKQSDNARTYKDVNGNVFKSQETATFNTSYNDYYNSANSNVFGYDPNSNDIAGSATMARHPDITDADIAMDFNKSNITNENLKKLLTSAKIVKYKTGHYGYVTPDGSVQESGEQGNGEKIQGGESVKLRNELDKETLPEKEEQVTIPETPSKLAMNAPFIGAGLLDAYLTNDHINELSKKMPFAVRQPVHLNRPVYGNLRALAEANRRAGLRNAMAKQLFTSDQSFNAALMLDTFNKNVEDWQQALAVDDDTYKETAEKARQEKKEEYLTNQEIAWGNKQSAVQKEKEDILSDMTKVTANHQSRKNALDEFKTYLIADATKRNEEKLTLAHTRLWNHMQKSPVSYIGGWTAADLKLWNRYLAGETITDPSERLKLMKILNMMEEIYLQKRYPNAKFKTPHMNDLRFTEPEYDIIAAKRKGGLLKYIKLDKKGGSITNDQVKAIIAYLKESNKNYNKAIDRSVRGLYNSIKLQKLRKK